MCYTGRTALTRKKLWADMQASGLVIKEEAYQLNVPRSQRGGEIIEPMVSTRNGSWRRLSRWPTCAGAAPCAMAASASFRNALRRSTITGWRISRIGASAASRGHRIPVWYCARTAPRSSSAQDPTSCRNAAARSSRTLTCWIPGSLLACGRSLRTLGSPDQTPDFKYFYPTSVLETGYDSPLLLGGAHDYGWAGIQVRCLSTPSTCTA